MVGKQSFPFLGQFKGLFLSHPSDVPNLENEKSCPSKAVLKLDLTMTATITKVRDFPAELLKNGVFKTTYEWVTGGELTSIRGVMGAPTYKLVGTPSCRQQNRKTNSTTSQLMDLT